MTMKQPSKISNNTYAAPPPKKQKQQPAKAEEKKITIFLSILYMEGIAYTIYAQTAQAEMRLCSHSLFIMMQCQIISSGLPAAMLARSLLPFALFFFRSLPTSKHLNRQKEHHENNNHEFSPNIYVSGRKKCKRIQMLCDFLLLSSIIHLVVRL